MNATEQISEKNYELKGYSYTSKKVPGDEYAFDVTVKKPDGKTLEFRVLTFGEVNSSKSKE